VENKINKFKSQLKVTTLDKKQLYIHIKRNIRYLKKDPNISEVNIKHVIISYIDFIYIEIPVCSKEDTIKINIKIDEEILFIKIRKSNKTGKNNSKNTMAFFYTPSIFLIFKRLCYFDIQKNLPLLIKNY